MTMSLVNWGVEWPPRDHSAPLKSANEATIYENMVSITVIHSASNFPVFPKTYAQ